MKCVPFEESRLLKWAPPFIVNIKYDGDRCVAEWLHSGEYLLLSSEENPFLMLPHIQQALKDSRVNLKLDGELYDHNLCLEGGHELIHGVASRSVNLHPRYKELGFYIFDIQTETEPQYERIKTLNHLKELIKPPLFIAPYWICNDFSEIKKVYDQVIKQGYEGIVIKNLYAHYEINKRSRWQMKFKPKRSDTYTIIGWNEEISKDGIPKGRIGSIILSSQQGDTFAVSAGLNDEDREKYWSIRHLLAGNEAIVHYQHLTNKQIPKGTFDIEILMGRDPGMAIKHQENYGGNKMSEEREALYEFYVAGVQFHQLKECINKLSETQELSLVPDPDNSYDPNAVAIKYGDVMLGFVPKAKGAFSDRVSATLEHRKLSCFISELNPKAKTWEQLKVVIFDEGEKE